MNTENSTLQEKEIIIDSNLKVLGTKWLDDPKWNSTNAFLQMDMQLPKNEQLVVDKVGQFKKKHKNYLNYLKYAWDTHLGIVITPDILWHMILSEIAGEIKSNPEEYRFLFTTSESKKNITIITFEMEDMPVDKLISALREHVPSDMNKFLPTFSTSTEMSQLAFNLAFADMVSPYYAYYMTLCGISKIKVLGTSEDYAKLVSSVFQLEELFAGKNTMITYLKKVFNILSLISQNIDSKEDDVEFWKSIFSIERCGSGHDDKIHGWITEFYQDPKGRNFPGDFSPMCGVIEYEQTDTERKFKKYAGLFGSQIEEDYLVPEFSYFVAEVK